MSLSHADQAASLSRSPRRVRIPLVWYTLIHDARRTSVAILGVVFAAILMFMQLGFLGAVRTTATTLLEKLDFDLLLVSPTYLYFYDTGTFPRIRLDQARSLEGVKDTLALHVGFNTWSRSASEGQGATDEVALRPIFVIGYDLAAQPFRAEAFHGLNLRLMRPIPGGTCLEVRKPGDLALLRRPGTVLIDRDSHPDFGPMEQLDPCAGDETKGAKDHEPAKAILGQQEVEVIGAFDLSIGFGADGALLVDDANFRRHFGGRSSRDVSLGLVQLEPSANVDQVAEAMEVLLTGEDVQVLTRAEVLEQEEQFWTKEKPVGIIFGLGIGVACAVGVVFVYQILSSDITKRFSEFATLKAMGYPDRTVSGLVIRQALVLSHAGYVPGLIIAAILEKGVSLWTRMPVGLTWNDAGLVYIASVLICMISALLAVGKVRKADPAELFA